MKATAIPDRRRVLATILSTVSLVACVPSLPGGGEPPRTFRLTPKTTFPADLAKVAWSLAVDEPIADRALDTNRVAVVSRGTQIDYVANSVWIERAPTMIQGLIVQSFRASGAVMAVGTTREQQQPDLLLRSSLRVFQVNQDGETSNARVALDAELLTMPDRSPVEQAQFNSDIAAGAKTMDEIVTAFDEALGKVLKSLVLWTLDVGSKIEPKT